jgi:hypothetical protein
MSRLLLAKAARVCGWPPERWRDGWPDLLTARELANLESPNDGGDARAILEFFYTTPPPADDDAGPVNNDEYARAVLAIAGRPVPAGVRLDEVGTLVLDGLQIDRPRVKLYRAGTYRDWPMRDWEPSPLIAAWLDTQAPQDAPALVEESPSKPRAHTQDRPERLTVVLDEIEARALVLNKPFDRSEWPGTKDEFRAFLRWKDSGLAYRLPTDDGRLSDELRPHGVKFGRPGRDKTTGLKFYRALFPDYPA